MNLLMVIAVYASVCKELGLPLRFPGSVATYDSLYNVTDAELLGRATVWAGADENAAGEIFNVTNGDAFRWRHIWPAFARYFGLEYAEPVPMSLTEHMADKQALWERMVERHGLLPTSWQSLVSWQFGDAIFSLRDNIASTIKIRQAGFADCYDTEHRFLELFDRLRNANVIPR
jgi:nucleoside-diphosphate-sugar epimerase